MSEEELKEAYSDVLVKKVNKMYENYGIDPIGLDEGDIHRVYEFYSKNPEKLDADFKKSKNLKIKFGEEDII